MATAVLSTTAKAKKAEKGREAAKREGGAGADAPMGEAADGGAGKDKGGKGEPAAEGGEAKTKAEGAAPKDKEPQTQALHNPARVLPQQEALLSVPATSRYQPVVKEPQAEQGAGGGAGGRTKLLRLSGFVLLEDKTPSEPQELLEPAPTGSAAVPAGMEEPALPAPFQFADDA